MPLVSVIMPVYNGEQFLAEAIESILTQTFADLEFIIVDDGSEDGSVPIIQDCAKRDRRIRFLQHKANMGIGAACNTGVAAASGEYITRMDCDDISLPTRLEKQTRFLQTNPDIGAVGTCGWMVHQDLTKYYHRNQPSHHALIVLAMFHDYAFINASVMIRREFLQAVGGYEPSRRRAADSELQFRLICQTKIKFTNLKEDLYLYRRVASQQRNERKAVEWRGNWQLRERMLHILWKEAPTSVLKRMQDLLLGKRLNWAQRRATKQDLKRLIESLIAHNWVDAEDRPLLLAAMNRRLEQASPRLWQKFCHWRRHRLGF